MAKAQAQLGLRELDQSAALAAVKHMELVRKGYPSGTAQAAIDRALGTAEARVRPISEPIRYQAFLDILRHELTLCDKWCQRELSFFDSQQATTDDGD